MIPTSRSTVRRLPERARYDRATVDAILDEGLVCHVGFVDDGQPFVIPAAYARQGDRLVIHGSAASRMVKRLAAGEPACVTVTLLDGLVLARSAFHHSVNYRSVVIFGRTRAVADPDRKRELLRAFTERLYPGRWSAARPPSEQELKATLVVELPLREVVAKLRTGGPIDDAEDMALPVWAGVVPLRLVAGAPEPAPDLAGDPPSAALAWPPEA